MVDERLSDSANVSASEGCDMTGPGSHFLPNERGISSLK